MAQKGRSWACGFQGGSGSLSRAPGLPLPRAGLSPGGPQQHFLYVLAPFSPSVTSQSPRITASPRHPCSGPESPQAARGSQGKGKRRGRRRHPQEVSRTPAHTTTPVQVVTHPTPPPPRAQCRFIPELTARRPAEPDNEKQVHEAKMGLGATHLSLCHLDLDFAGVEHARSEERILSGEADTALLGPPTSLCPDAPPQARPAQSLTGGFPRLLARDQGVATSSSSHLFERFAV